MKDYSKKLHNLKENSESVFEGILGYKAGKNAVKGDKNWNQQISTSNLTNGFLFENDYLQVNPDESIVFKKEGSTIEKVSSGWDSLTKLNFGDENYNWLAIGKFNCESINVNKGVISFVRGDWNGGLFRGNMYESNFNGGYFDGRLFKSGNWRVNPFRFVNGKISTPGSILGIRDITNLNQNKFNFNIISVTPGNKISIQMQDGKTHEITISKRLDSKDSNFIFNIKNAAVEQSTTVNVKWSQIHGNSESDFTKNTAFSNSHIPELFTNLFKLQFAAPITKVVVTDSTDFTKGVDWNEAEQEKTEQELAVTQQQCDLNKAPFLGIKKLGGEYWNEKGILVKNNVGRVYFHASNNEYLKQFESVVKNLDNNIISSDFSQLRANLANKVITGAPKGYPWLANLIGVDTSGNQVEDKNFAGSLDRIEAFLKYFVATIVKYAGKSKREKGDTNVPNTEIQELIKTNLKNYLGIESPEGAASEVPGAAPAAEPAQRPKPQIKMKEGVVKAVRDILSENL